MKETQEKLLSCPFCGKEPNCMHWTGWYVGCVRVSGCNLRTVEYETAAEAIAAWNHRATPALTPEARAEYNRLKDLEPDSLMRYVEAFQDAMKLLDALIAAGKVRGLGRGNGHRIAPEKGRQAKGILRAFTSESRDGFG